MSTARPVSTRQQSHYVCTISQAQAYCYNLTYLNLLIAPYIRLSYALKLNNNSSKLLIYQIHENISINHKKCITIK